MTSPKKDLGYYDEHDEYLDAWCDILLKNGAPSPTSTLDKKIEPLIEDIPIFVHNERDIVYEILENKKNDNNYSIDLRLKKYDIEKFNKKIGVIEMRFYLLGDDDFIPLWMKLNAYFCNQTVTLTFLPEDSRGKGIEMNFGYYGCHCVYDNAVGKSFNYEQNDELIILYREKVLTEIFRVWKKASDLTSIKEFSDPVKKERFKFHLWNNAKNIDNSEYNENESFCGTFFEPNDYYCGRFIGMNLMSDWVDPINYCLKNCNSIDDMYEPFRNAVKAMNLEFPSEEEYEEEN